MSRHTIALRRFAAVAGILLVGACAQNAPPPPPAPVASNPPRVSPGPAATWSHVYFDSNSFVVNANGRRVINDLVVSLQKNPNSVVTIIGRTDKAGSADFNMHLSHKRADAVRDALVYDGTVGMDRVETRWTGEGRQTIAPANEDPEASKRVVDIAVH
jgi:outer membrane protein OmpA-like peptidoglycan-associated protein